MKKITEDDIENLAIEFLKEQGFQHFFGPESSSRWNTALS